MAAILNSANLNSTMLDSTILVFPLKLTHTCQDWFPTFAQKKLHSFILTQLEWWQPSWIMPSWIQTPCYLLSDSFKNTLTPLWLWLQLIQSDSKSFILTQLDDCSHIEFCHLCSHFAQKKLHSFIQTQLDDGSHLEFCQLEFDHLGFNHLSFSCQTHSHLPRLVPNICTKNFTHSFWLNLMMAAILNSAILDSAILQKKTSLIFSDSIWW